VFEWLDQFDLLCFDFDGLLVNTEDLHYEAYKDMLLRHGYNLPWSFQAYCLEAHVSTSFLRNAVYGLFPDLEKIEPNWETLRQEKNFIYQRLIASHHIKLMDGVSELLKKIKSNDVRACVVTNSTLEQIEQIRAVLPELNIIKHWFTREDYDRSKPKPDGYLKALDKLAKPGDKVIGFEDTMKGVNALIGAKITPILIWPTSYPPLQTESSIPHFRSFLEITKEAL